MKPLALLASIGQGRPLEDEEAGEPEGGATAAVSRREPISMAWRTR